MRVIGILNNENDVRRFVGYLKRKGIETNSEGSFDAGTGHMTYPIWVHDEDRIEEAQKDFEHFKETPSHAIFDVPVTEQISAPQEELVEEIKRLPRRATSPFTVFILSLCISIFFLNFLQEKTILQEGMPKRVFLTTPIQGLLLFDFPESIEKIEKIAEKYAMTPDQKGQKIPLDVQAEFESLSKVPFWRGIYDWIIFKIRGEDTSSIEGPLFQKISQGEIWRLFSPAVLHTETLHILFNMIWVWILSRPIEQRIGIFRLMILTLIVGIGSNVAQYLMSGPFFLGYSGVVMGLAGFTWMREKVAPWEGYPLQRSVILFLLVFVGGMFVAQFVSFIFQAFTEISFSLNIANSAHIAGALIGAALGCFPFFSMRVNR